MAKNHPVARCIQACGIAGLLSLTSTSTLAAGFALIEQSVSSMGTAYAGAGSISEDASTVFFNPASMARLEGSQLSSGLHIILPNSEFKGGNSYNSSNPAIAFAGLGGIPVGSQGDGGNGGVDAVVPHFTYVHDINNKWNFGFSVNAPFGLSTEYNKNWAGRYSAVESEIVTVNLNPTLSFRIDEHASIGFGVSAMYASLLLKSAFDDGLAAALGGAPFPGWAPGSSAFDSRTKVDIDDWGFGFNFGVLLEPTDHTRFGLAYRSKIDVELDGDLKTNSLVTSSQKAESDISLPDTLLLSAYHEVTPKTAIMADILWTQWSKIDDLSVKFTDRSTNAFHLEWEDTIRVAFGASYKYNSAVTLRTGVAYDESPVPNKELRPAALPDNDRIWLDFGIGYRYSNQLSFDFAYAHLFIDDPKINSTDADSSSIPGNDGLHRLTGEFDASVDIFSGQVNWKF